MQLANEEAVRIPVIDISTANTQTGDELVNAVVQYGFVFVKSKGVGFTKQIIDEMFQLVRSCSLCS